MPHLFDFRPGSTEQGGRLPLERQQEIQKSFEDFLEGMTDILREKDPEVWLPALYRYLRKTERGLDSFDQRIQEYLAKRLGDVFAVLREQAEEGRMRRGNGESSIDHAQAAVEVIHRIEQLFAPTSRVERHFTVRRVSMEQLLEDREHFSYGEIVSAEAGRLPALKVRASREDPWHALPLSESDRIMHKGGTPRVVLKILAGAPREQILAELPPNDFDVLGHGDEAEVRREAVRMGVDLEGIEQVDSFDDPNFLFASRDIDLNQCFLGRNGLMCSQQAVEAAKTGRISLQAEERGIYGSEKLYYDGVELAKNRGVQRLLKFVAEGKATSFEFTQLNEQIDFGIYWLTLARKFAKKPNAGELLNRLYFLGCQIGQVRDGENDIYDVLERVHQAYPFFAMEDGGLDQTGVARWLGGKMTRFVGRHFRKEERISLGFTLERHDGDTVPYRVSLEGYATDEEGNQTVVDEWPRFIAGCRQRTADAPARRPGLQNDGRVERNPFSATRAA